MTLMYERFCCIDIEPGWNMLLNPEYFDGLVHERRNSSALAMGYVFLALTHRFIFTFLQYSIDVNMVLNLVAANSYRMNNPNYHSDFKKNVSKCSIF